MFLKIIIFLLYSFFLFGCTEHVLYSGKIINNNLDYKNIINKNQLIDKLGEPNYVDLIDNKYYYFSEKTVSKNFFNEKIKSRDMIVYNFDSNNNIISVNEFNLNNEKKISVNKDKTLNNLSQKGIIERVFGGVGKRQLSNPSQ